MKSWTVLVTLPDLVAHHAQQRVTVQACAWPVAVYRGVREVMKRPQVRGRRLSEMKISVIPISTVVASADSES